LFDETAITLKKLGTNIRLSGTMNPFAVFFVAVFLLIPFLLLTIALANDLTGIFYAIDGSSFTPVANIVNYMLWAFVILAIALIAVMIIYRKYT